MQDAIPWTYRVKSKRYSLAIARFVGIFSLSSACMWIGYRCCFAFCGLEAVSISLTVIVALLVPIHWSAMAGNIQLDSKSAFALSRFVAMVLLFYGYILSICLLCWRSGGFWAIVGVGRGVGGVWAPVRPSMYYVGFPLRVSRLIGSPLWWADLLWWSCCGYILFVF